MVAAIRMTPSVEFEAVHLDKELIERLLALVVATAETGAAMAADGVDLVDEDDARGALLALLEHVAHARGADADEHLDEVGARDRKERHVRLAGDGAGEQSLAGARRADEQTALRDAAAEALELLRVLEELDDLLKLLLRLIDAGNIGEGDAAGLFGQKPRPRFAEAHGLAAAGLHLPHEENPDADQEQHREPGDEHAPDGRRAILGRLGADAHVVLLQTLDQLSIVRRKGRDVAPVTEDTGDRLTLQGHLAHLSSIDLLDEVGVGERLLGAARRRSLEQIEQGEHEKRDDDPEGQVTADVHVTFPDVRVNLLQRQAIGEIGPGCESPSQGKDSTR